MDILKDKKTGFGEESEWDKKKILLFLVFLFVLIGVGYKTRDKFLYKILPPKTAVKGESTSRTNQNSISVKPINLQEKVEELKSQISNLNVKDIASSSPQVQQILNQVKDLGNLPKTQAKQMCERICSGL